MEYLYQTNKNYHVSKRSEDGKWQVKFANGQKAIKLFATQAEAIEFAKKALAVIEAYKAFDGMRPIVLDCENRIRRFTPRCYAKIGKYEKAAEELAIIAKNCAEILSGKDKDEIDAYTQAKVEQALYYIEEYGKDKVMAYSKF